MMKYFYVYIIGYVTFIQDTFREDWNIANYLITGKTNDTDMIPWEKPNDKSIAHRFMCTLCPFRPCCKYFTDCGMKEKIAEVKDTPEAKISIQEGFRLGNELLDREMAEIERKRIEFMDSVTAKPITFCNNVNIKAGGRQSGKTTWLTQNWQQLNQDNGCGNYLVMCPTYNQARYLLGSLEEQEPRSEQMYYRMSSASDFGNRWGEGATTYAQEFKLKPYVGKFGKNVQWANYINYVAKEFKIAAVFIDNAENVLDIEDLKRDVYLDIPVYFTFGDKDPDKEWKLIE